MLFKRLLLTTIAALIAFGAILLLETARPFAYVRVRNLYRDAINRAGRTTPPNPNLVFLAIDSDSVGIDETDINELYKLPESSIEGRALGLMSKAWPWPREIYALILERLMAAGARAVAFDLTFPTSTEDDSFFRLSLERHKERVVIGSNFVSAERRGGSWRGAALTVPPDSIVPQSSPIDDRIGYTNFWPDEDDIVRRAQYRLTFQQVQSETVLPGSEKFDSLGTRLLSKAGFGDTIPDDLADHLFRFTAPARKGFPPRSIFEIFVPDYWKNNYQSGEFFRGKLVIIGAEGNWQHDEHPTPFGLMPGAELHLNAINAALNRQFIQEMSGVRVGLLTGIAGVLAILLSLVIRSPWLRLLALAAVDLMSIRAALLAFDRGSIYVPMVSPLFELNFTMLLGLVGDFTWERLEKNRFRRTLERYVSQNVVREMLDKPNVFARSLGGHLRPVTILFSDIRDFSSVAARTRPPMLVDQLNEYLTVMVECVFQFGGTLDKFVGDAVMAVWGNLNSGGPREDAANAVRAALAMRTKLDGLNKGWQGRGLSEFRIGIGIHHGEVVVGNIGSLHRMEFTVIGDAVNTSWKLQEFTKEVGLDLLVSEKVRSLVQEHFEMQSCGRLILPGVNSSVEVYAVGGPVQVELAEGAQLS